MSAISSNHDLVELFDLTYIAAWCRATSRNRYTDTTAAIAPTDAAIPNAHTDTGTSGTAALMLSIIPRELPISDDSGCDCRQDEEYCHHRLLPIIGSIQSVRRPKRPHHSELKAFFPRSVSPYIR